MHRQVIRVAEGEDPLATYSQMPQNMVRIACKEFRVPTIIATNSYDTVGVLLQYRNGFSGSVVPREYPPP